MKTALIINPNAGTADRFPEREFSDLPETTLIYPSGRTGIRQATRNAIGEGFSRIIAVGGDGTINEVLNGVVPDFDHVIFGVIPAGTANDFARSLKLPEKLPALLEMLQSNRTIPLDVAQMGGGMPRYYINVSAGGFGGKVDEKMTKEIKERWGPLAYFRSAMEALPELDPYKVRVVLDTGERIETEVYNIIVANASFVAGGIPVAPESKLDDGLLDLVMIRAGTLQQLAVLGPLLLAGKHLESDLVIFRQAKKIEITSDRPMLFNADGELCGETPVQFEVGKKISVLVPVDD